MEAVGPSEDHADGGVGAFVAGVRDPVEPGVRDFFEPQPEGAGEFHECRPGALGSRDPAFQQEHRFIEPKAVVGIYPAKSLFELVGPPDPLAGTFDRRHMDGLWGAPRISDSG